MRKIISLWAFTLLFTACSKNENSDIVFSEESIELHQKVFEEAVSYLQGNPSVDITTTADYVKTLDGVTDVIITGSAIEISTKGNVTFVLDFNSYPESDVVEIETKKMEQHVDSIEKTINLQRASGYEQTSEVFNDYIAKNTLSEGTTYSTSTRASTVQKVRLSRRTVAIWNPWKEFSFETEPILEVTSYINKKHQLQRFHTFAPASFAAFKDFDVIYLASHGYINGEIILPIECLTNEQKKLYNEEIKAKRVKLCSDKDGNIGLLLTKTFFDKYLPDLNNTVIYTSACYLGVNNSQFLSSCLKKNVADYFASDSICTAKHIVNHFEEFYIYLMYGYSTNRSFNNGRGYFIGSYVFDEKPWTYKYSRYGSKLVYYPKPVATGVANKSNISTRSGVFSESSIIVNSQLLYATEESGDILNSIEAGICLQDMETKEVKLIPFSNKNMVSNEKKSYGDVTVSNIAVSLDDLTEGHKYAYCCYTKMDGQITMSEECYWINSLNNYEVTFNMKIHFESIEVKENNGPPEYENWDRDGEISILKYNGRYYLGYDIPWQYALPSWIEQIYANRTKEYIYYKGRNNNYSLTYKLTCTLSSDNISLKLEYYDSGYTIWTYYVEGIEEIIINNFETNPSISISKNQYQYHLGDEKTSKYTLSSIQIERTNIINDVHLSRRYWELVDEY